MESVFSVLIENNEIRIKYLKKIIKPFMSLNYYIIFKRRLTGTFTFVTYVDDFT